MTKGKRSAPSKGSCSDNNSNSLTELSAETLKDCESVVTVSDGQSVRGKASTFFKEGIPDHVTENRSAMFGLLGGVYALVLVVFGITFPVSAALTFEVAERTFYLEVFQMYIYSVSIGILFYLHVFVLPNRNKIVDPNPDMCGKKLNQLNKLTIGQDPSKSEKVEAVLTTGVRAVTTDAEGVNFYLRLGAIAFGTGSMVHDGFKVAQVFELPDEVRDICKQPLYILISCVHLLFVFFQTYFVFKSHRVVINMHKPIVRLCLAHLVATNVCVWTHSTIYETAEDFKASSKANSEHRMNISEDLNSTEEGHFKCELEDSLAMKASPYLFPCTIEYSLIAAAILYKIFLNIGRLLGFGEEHEQSGVSVTDCHKANKGLFLGLLVFIGTTVAVAAFFVFDDKKTSDSGNTSTTIFFATELSLLLISCGIIIANCVIFQRLKFNPYREGNHHLDVNLLIIGLFGVCVFNLFLVISACSNISGNITAMLSVSVAVLGFVQALLQTVFILDALRRSAHSHEHVHNKPGRALVTCLLLCNLSLWVVNTFEVRKAETTDINDGHFGHLPWSIISHMAIPLLIFFRFHSTVCLSDIWIHAYVIKTSKVT